MKIIAVDLGGTKIDFGIVENNKLLSVRTIPTESDRGRDFVIKKLIDNISEILETEQKKQKEKNSGTDKGTAVQGIALAVPGPIDYIKGSVIFTPNMKGWKDVRLKDIIQKKFRIETRLDNDAHCFALGHNKKGTVVAITLGTGIGSGVIIDNKIVHGKRSATEIGHMIIAADGRTCGCGNKGCFEAYCSGTAIEKRYFELAKINKTAKEISEMKDKISKQVIDETAHYLAIGLNNIKNIFDPDFIVLGGSISKINYMIKKAQNEMARMPFSSKPKIEVTRIEYSALLGAARLFDLD
jgi:glucokinase